VRVRALLLLALLPAACQRAAQNPPPAARPSSAPASSPLDRARSRLQAGDLDGALGVLSQAGSGPEALYYTGLAWARKAELAPLPTPPPLPASAPRGGHPPPAPQFKPEELQAMEFFERTLAAQPGHPGASLGVGDLLAPHSLRRYSRPQATSAKRRGNRATEPAAPQGPDCRPERVIQAYRAATEGDPASRESVEKLIDFSMRVGRVDDADQGLQELLRREKERPEPFIRYGDFLLNVKKEPMAAIDQYRQALIWRPDDEATRARIADIYITQGIEHYGRNEYAVAEARFLDAQKWVADPRSPQGLRIQDYTGKLRAIRQPMAK